MVGTIISSVISSLMCSFMWFGLTEDNCDAQNGKFSNLFFWDGIVNFIIPMKLLTALFMKVIFVVSFSLFV